MSKYTLDAVGDDVHVKAHEQDINVNNIQHQAISPYSFTEVLTGHPLQRLTQPNKGVPTCLLCFREFHTYSQCEIHKAKPCYLDAPQCVIHPVQIAFTQQILPYIEDCLLALELHYTHLHETKDEQLLYAFQVDKSMLEITMRRLYMAQFTKYNLEQWYDSLVQLEATTKSTIYEFSDQELRLLLKLASVKLSETLGFGSRPTNAELAAREDLEDRITALCQPDQEYFVKFSTRSPKDAIAAKLGDDEKIEDKLNKKIKSLKVMNGCEAIELLVKSQRIFSDIQMYFQYRVEGCSSAKLSLILREWKDMPQDHEFRCFVYCRKLTAISQYHCYYAFDRLQDKEYVIRIREAIIECHEKIKSALPMNSYVVDVVVYPNEGFACHVIEINPFGANMSSGSALFHWEHHYDLLHDRLGRDNPAIWVLSEDVHDPNA